MKPTDEQLNRRMAETLGYYVVQYEGFCMLWKPDGSRVACPNMAEARKKTEVEAWADAPDFRYDYNALQEIYERLGKGVEWLLFLRLLKPAGSISYLAAWIILRRTPREQTIAALKALNAWPKEWEE